MISPQRLKALAREKNLSAGNMEKDYVNSWILYAIYMSSLDHVLFKGGTALSKIYFPKVWRFSEDLDLTLTKEVDVEEFKKELDSALEEASNRSGIDFVLKPIHSNPGYMQVDIQYNAVLGKNTTRLDISRKETVIHKPELKKHSFEDVPEFTLRVYSLEETLLEKIRSLFERRRARDFFDIYKMLQTENFNPKNIAKGLKKKMKAKNMSLELTIPKDKKAEVEAYWDKGLDWLISVAEKPEFSETIEKIENFLEELKKVDKHFK